MFKKIKDTIAVFLKVNRRLALSCLILTLILVGGYFSIQSPKADLNNCNGTETNENLNTTTVPNKCIPVVCSSLPSAADAKTPDNPDGYNCYYMQSMSIDSSKSYYGKPIPPCKTYAGADGKKPRENCADLIDLPICSEFRPYNGDNTAPFRTSQAVPNINCVMEARSITTGVGTRGRDYAVHNKDSIRFTGAVESCGSDPCDTGLMNSGTIRKKCHQIKASETAPNDGTNCDNIKCHLLTIDELKVIDNRFADSSKKYCDGSTKCYNFFNNTLANATNSSNLQYIKYYPNSNTMCQIHSCFPESSLCGTAQDRSDVPNLLAKDATYKSNYVQYINGRGVIEAGLCKRVNCQPVVHKKFTCTTPSTLHASCDQCVRCSPSESCPAVTGGCALGTKTQTCDSSNSNSCIQIIDCNNSANVSEPECVPPTPTNDNTDPDPFNAWFYRPVPLSSVLDSSTHLIKQDVIDQFNNMVDHDKNTSTAKQEFDSDTNTAGVQKLDADANTAGIQPFDSDPNMSGDQPLDSARPESHMCYFVGNDLNQPKEMGFGRTDIIGGLWVYWHLPTESTRSPQICGVGSQGFRGNGYGFVCRNKLDLYSAPQTDIGYIRGPAKVDYDTSTGKAVYKIKGCLRYGNIFDLAHFASTGMNCGARECRFSISHGSLSSPVVSQECGYDYCLEMKIHDGSGSGTNNDPDRCSMKKYPDIFNGTANPKPDCLSDPIDLNVRMRARKYGNKICVFVDRNLVYGNSSLDFDGTETLDDLTCVDGEKNSSGTCVGQDTASDDSSLSVWRTSAMIRYIGNAFTGTHRAGYKDINGKFFASQDCAKVPLRVGPPRFYQVATIANTVGLFDPILYISNVMTARGGAAAVPAQGELFANTDFFRPEIEITKSTQVHKMSLGRGFLGNDSTPESYPTSPWTKLVRVPGLPIQYDADVYIKKEYNESIFEPTLCLYRKMKDQRGNDIDPIRLYCVKRNIPEISDIYPAITGKTRMRVSIVADPTNTFRSAKLKLKLMDFGANNINNSCTGDDTCSNEVEFTNPNADVESCKTDIEAHKICVKRDPCSKLLYECADNEIKLHDAQIAGTSTTAFETIKTQCNTSLLTSCNRKMGIVSTTAPDFFSQINASASVNLSYQSIAAVLNNTATVDSTKYPNAYGWFNELCVVRGFKGKLKNIVAYPTVDGIVGKCLIDSNKSNPIAGIPCSAGGKAPYCVCQEATTAPTGMIIRQETPREAGLCIDIPIPKFCPAIDYTTTNGSNDDPDFTESSITKAIGLFDTYISSHSRSLTDFIAAINSSAIYNDSTAIHTSHQSRSSSSSEDTNYAEYNSIIAGTNTVYGACKGFWKEQVDSSNPSITLHPTLNCGANGQWNKTGIANSHPCIRNTCPAVPNPVIQGNSGVYPNGYADGEVGEERGRKHGFAYWSAATKTTDFLQYVTASECITGYRTASGTLPSRYCDQKGNWQNGFSSTPLTNQCVRKTCPAQNIASGTLAQNPTTSSEIQAWNNNGGAQFDTGKASLSDSYITINTGSIVTGSCYRGLSQANAAPIRECDSDGNWGTVQNPCVVSGCPNIGATDANGGNATWSAPSSSPNVGSSVSATGTCIGGTNHRNPYPQSGVNDTPKDPTRTCDSRYIQASDSFQTAWGAITDACVNKCPGFNEDPRVGAGVTNGDDANSYIYWSATDPGKYDYKYACTGAGTGMTALTFNTQGRTNGCYLIRRYCGSNHKWSNPQPMCVAAGGQIGNATYTANSNLGGTYDDAVDVGSTAITGQCATNYFPVGNLDTNKPQMQCTYNSGNRMDQVYFKLIGGQDCKRCEIAANQTFGTNGDYYAGTTTKYAYVGEVVNLTRASGKCGAGTPTVTCQTDGSLILTNSSRSCNSCDSSRTDSNKIDASYFYNITGMYDGGSDVRWRRDVNNGCSKQIFKHTDFLSSNFTTAHGANTTVCRYAAVAYSGSCNGVGYINFTSNTLNFSCYDGRYTVTEAAVSTAACDGTASAYSSDLNQNFDRPASARVPSLIW